MYVVERAVPYAAWPYHTESTQMTNICKKGDKESKRTRRNRQYAHQLTEYVEEDWWDKNIEFSLDDSKTCDSLPEFPLVEKEAAGILIDESANIASDDEKEVYTL